MSDWLTIGGSIGSIVGAALSAYILWTVRQLRVRYLFQARVPELIKSLRGHAKDLSRHLSGFDESLREIDTVIARVAATLKNLRAKVRKDERRAVSTALKMIKRRNQPTDKETAWNIYNELQAVIEGLEHLAKDTRWSR